MIRIRAALAIPASVLVLSGCGVTAAVMARTTTASVALPKPAGAVTGTPLRSLPRPAVTAAPTVERSLPPPAAAPDIVATASATGGDEWLEILNPAGSVMARTRINPTLPWLVAAGAGGAYWTEKGAEHELTPSGSVRTLGPVPGDATGVLIAPDGMSYAYATSDQSTSDAATNRIAVVRPGAPAIVIADRVSDPNHPSADAPSSWEYYLIRWNGPGITFARVPQGGCGCGAFDMQMQSAYSAIINPDSEAVTPLTSDNVCPLSAMGPGMEVACFTGAASSDGLRISIGGTVTHHFALSGANLAGDTVFSPTGASLAYVTIPAAENTCGATWTTTLRILNLATGVAVSRAVGDFAPAAWAANGLIYGSMTAGSTTWLAAVNPTSLSVTRLTPDAPASQLVGLT